MAQVENHLLTSFVDAMAEIGAYGYEKYGDQSFEARATNNDLSRGTGSVAERTTSTEIGRHAGEHFSMYLRGERHDKFNTLRHQLAAVAFNAMMEYYFAGLEDE